MQLDKTSVLRWSVPAFDAFCAGIWMFVWTDHVLYWVRKPKVHVEQTASGRRLHCPDGPACANAIENLYFLHGILVPAYAVLRPEWITLKEIQEESNEEIRRTLIEQFGWEKYLHASQAKVLDTRRNDRDGQVERLYVTASGPRRFVCVDPSTGRRYALGVPQEITSCEAAQNWLSSGLDRYAIHRS
jgi:hypothetical protein